MILGVFCWVFVGIRMLIGGKILCYKIKVSCKMDLGANKTPVEVIKEGAFEGRYCRDISSSVTGKWYKQSWKEFDQLESTDQKYYCSDYYDVNINKYGVKCGTSLRF